MSYTDMLLVVVNSTLFVETFSVIVIESLYPYSLYSIQDKNESFGIWIIVLPLHLYLIQNKNSILVIGRASLHVQTVQIFLEIVTSPSKNVSIIIYYTACIVFSNMSQNKIIKKTTNCLVIYIIYYTQ